MPGELPLAEPAKDAAERLAAKSQIDFDIEFFTGVLDRAPDCVDVLRCLGQLLSRKGLHPQAVEIDRRLAALCPSDAVAHYNLACSLARCGRQGDAIESLRLAFEAGYSDFEYLESDADLDTLRRMPAFRDLLARFMDRA